VSAIYKELTKSKVDLCKYKDFVKSEEDKAMYTEFAYVYNRLMYDIDYKAWADYIERIFIENSVEPSLILDLGCGTGNFCIEMAKRRYEMIGVDLSPEMLACAKDKSIEENVDILFINQDMTEFELYGTVDSIVCLMDSINYVITKRELKKMFALVKNYLNPGGLFIFDVNTCYKLETVLGNEVFYDIADDLTYIWQNSFDKKKKICRFDLTFFAQDKDGYRRYDEVHVERGYSLQELKEIIKASGLELVSVYNELSFSKPTAKSQRVFFVCRERS